jgi:membrane protease YdiL (CAAX protease family)
MNIVWNPSERRLRALLRLVFGLIFFLILTVIFSFALQLGVMAVLAASNRLPLTDLQGMTVAVLEAMTTLWWVTPLNSLLTLLAVKLTLFLAGRLLDRRPFAAFGFHFNQRWWEDFGFGLFLGGLLMALIFLAEWALGWIEIRGTLFSFIPEISFAVGIFALAIHYLGVGFYEEMLFRGYFLRNLAEGLNLPKIGPKTALLLAWVISSGVFGLAHLGNPNATWISSLNIAIAGLFLGLGYLLTRELALPIGLHITWNFFQGGVFGFPVSGTGNRASFIAIQQGGPEVWTGGAFGPEAGLIGLLAMLLGSLLIWIWVRLRVERAELQTDLSVYTPRESQPAFSAPGTRSGSLEPR